MRIEVRGPSGQAAACIFEKEGETLVAARGALMAASAGASVQNPSRGMGDFMGRLAGGGGRLLVEHTGLPNSFIVLSSPEGRQTRLIEVRQPVHVVQSALLFFEGTLQPSFIRPTWQSFLAGYGANVTVLTGAGQAGLCGGGFVEELTLEKEEISVDPAHVVGWDGSLKLDFRAVPGRALLARAVSGDLLGATFSGEGRLWLQTARG